MNSRAWSRAVVDCVRQNSLSSASASFKEMTEKAVLSIRRASSGVRSIFVALEWLARRLTFMTLSNNEATLDIMDHNRREEFEKRETEPDRNFYVRAPSVNAVRRALDRAPGGAQVVGRHDRETILCTHTMDGHSLARHWKVIVSRLGKAGLAVVPRPPREPGPSAPLDQASDR